MVRRFVGQNVYARFEIEAGVKSRSPPDLALFNRNEPSTDVAEHLVRMGFGIHLLERLGDNALFIDHVADSCCVAGIGAVGCPVG